jgi:hypothetical protein
VFRQHSGDTVLNQSRVVYCVPGTRNRQHSGDTVINQSRVVYCVPGTRRGRRGRAPVGRGRSLVDAVRSEPSRCSVVSLAPGVRWCRALGLRRSRSMSLRMRGRSLVDVAQNGCGALLRENRACASSQRSAAPSLLSSGCDATVTLVLLCVLGVRVRYALLSAAKGREAVGRWVSPGSRVGLQHQTPTPSRVIPWTLLRAVAPKARGRSSCPEGWGSRCDGARPPRDPYAGSPRENGMPPHA